jgi:3-deoxy-D-manno-octulosonic-acid transferase
MVMGFSITIPQQLNFKKGDSCLSTEDLLQIEGCKGESANQALSSQEGNASWERIIFYGSGYGELLLANLLANRLEQENFDFHWWFTLFHGSVYEQIKDRVNPANIVKLYQQNLVRTLQQTSPTLLCVVEYSYPVVMSKMIRLCAGWLNIPVFILAARLHSDWISSMQRRCMCEYRIFRKAIDAVSYVVTDDHETARKFADMKVDEDRIITGPSYKWHTGTRPVSNKNRRKARTFWNLKEDEGMVLVFGSLHESEIQAVLGILQKLISEHDVRAIIAPHGSLRPLIAAAMILNAKLSYSSWSKMGSQGDPKPRILLVDRLGELSSIYSCGDVAFVGGGFDPNYRGHNVVEAVAADVPVIIGPDFRNFQSIVNPLMENKGIYVAESYDDLYNLLKKMIMSEKTRKRTAENAAAVYHRFSADEPVEQKLLRRFFSQRHASGTG